METNYLGLGVYLVVMLTPVVLWGVVFRKRYRRSIPFSAFLAIVGSLVVLGCCEAITGGPRIRTKISMAMGLGMYLVYVISPIVLLKKPSTPK